MSEYRIHPLATTYPSLREIDPDGFSAMVEDMRANGWNGEPATLLDGQILDGRSRYEAWLEAGNKGNGDVPVKEFDGPDPVEFVRRQNGQRRNLSAGQKVISYLKASGVLNQDVERSTGTFPTSRELAKVSGVHFTTAASAIKLCTNGIPELIDAAWRGLISVSQAEEISEESHEEQASRLDDLLLSSEPVASEKKTRQQEKAEREVADVREFFFSRIAKLADGGRYTREAINKAIGLSSQGDATWFLRMCEIAPQVRVHRTYGHRGLGQYAFEYDPDIQDAWGRVRHLLEQIGNRPDSSAQDRLDAEEAIKILSL